MVRGVNVKKTKSSKKIVLKITMSMTVGHKLINKEDKPSLSSRVLNFFWMMLSLFLRFSMSLLC